MKTFTRKIVLITAAMFLAAFVAKADHWDFDGGNTGEAQWQIWIYGATMPNGDSFTEDDEFIVKDGSTIVGHLKLTVTPSESNWTSCGLVAYSVLEDGSDGYTGGNDATIIAYDASGDEEYTLSDWTFHPNWYMSHEEETFPGDASTPGWGYSYVSIGPAPQYGDLEGTVYEDDGETGAEEITVIAGSSDTTETDENGEYTFDDLGVGDYTITFFDSTLTYKTTTLSVTISEGTTTTASDVTLELHEANYDDFPGGNPAGDNWTLYIQSAQIDGVDMQPLDEIVILDGTTICGHIVLAQVCTSDNKFENDLIAFAELSDGTTGYEAGNDYTFKAYDLSADAEYTSNSVTLGGAYTGDDFPDDADTYSYLTVSFSAPNGTLAGTVTDDATPANNIEGATVTATNQSTSTEYTDETDASGEYSISCPAGTYDILVAADGYSSNTDDDNTVTSGGTTTVDIVLTELAAGSLDITLREGYQFVSRNVEPDDIDMDDIVRLEDDITANLDFIKNTDADLYIQTTPPAWTNGIGDWVKEEGYLFKMDAEDELSISGDQLDPASTPIDLAVGTQFIAYIPTFSMDIETAFADILDNLDWAKNSDGEKLRKIGGTWIDNIGTIGEGEGIQVKMTGTDQLTYRSTPPTPPALSPREFNELQYFIFNGGDASKETYTLYITSPDLDNYDEVAAFDGDKLVGAMIYDPDKEHLQNDLNVFSVTNNGPGYEAGNPIILKAWDASENKVYSLTYEMTNADPYQNAYVGEVYPEGDVKFSVLTVYKSSFGIDEITGSAIKVYPVPAKDIVNIASPVNVERIVIYNLVGKVVKDEATDGTFIRMNTSDYQPGVYIMKMQTEAGIVTKRLSIQ